MDRRSFLASVPAAVGATAAAGCLGLRSAAGDGLVLESVDAAGSPGGRVAIRPPGRAVLLDFFATWCAPCVPEMANLGVVRERFAASELFVVSVTSESDRGAVRSFWREHGGTWPAALDTDLAATQRYGVKGLPTVVALSPDGEEVGRHRGLAGEARLVEFARRAIDAGSE